MTEDSWWRHFVHRYFRISPAYYFVLFFFTWTTPLFTSGPYAHKTGYEACHTLWWTNLLYVNNIFPRDNVDACMGHTWYLAIDMQVFAILNVH